MTTYSAEHMGLIWTPEGVCIGDSDKSVNLLLEIMKRVPSTLKGAQKLRGCIEASSGAFQFNADEKLYYKNQIMAPINENIKQYANPVDGKRRHGKFVWLPSSADAVADLSQRFKNQPRVYIDPGQYQ